MSTPLVSMPQLVTLATLVESTFESRWQRTKRRKTNEIVRRLNRQYNEVWRVQQREFIKQFRFLRPLFPRQDLAVEAVQTNNIQPALIAAEDATRTIAIEIVQDAIETALIAGGESLMNTVGVGLGIAFDVTDPNALSFLEAQGAVQVTGIDESTRRGINRIIVQAANEGWSWQTTANVIIDTYEGFRSSIGGPSWFANRGELVAVTEIGNAYEQGSLLAAQQLATAGLIMEKRWSGPLDDRTSQACRGNLAQGWIPLDQSFSSGDERPLNHPGCRHTTLYRRTRINNEVNA